MAQESNPVGPDFPEPQPSNTAASSSSPTTGEIRAQIEDTRAEMSETIDAIQARLSPGRLMDNAKQSVKDATVGRVKRLASATDGASLTRNSAAVTAERAIHVIKATPIPFAIGAAAAAALATRLVIGRRASHRDHQRMTRAAAKRPALSTGRRGDRGRILVTVCATGLGCWSAWKANTSAPSRQA